MTPPPLARYEATRAALAVAASVDEAKRILNSERHPPPTPGWRRTTSLYRQATDIRVRAEIRLGEMILAQKETVGLAKGAAGIGKPASAVPEKSAEERCRTSSSRFPSS
jgi:hypothetical protein